MKVRAAGKFSVKLRGVGGGLGGRSDAFKVTLGKYRNGKLDLKFILKQSSMVIVEYNEMKKI